ncbi:AraC family transcriptional regulator [Paenibacillus sp. GYB003]|uniref:AraC family transcriptional regulator n=1 Tax=Paenibacillus sp. GYB003 TaxID=2994392 RepID=UPI002F9611A2
MLLQICSLLLRHYDTDTIDAWHQFYSKYAVVRSGLTYIQSHYHENITLEHVAEAMALSPSRTRHLFVEVMGMGVRAYLIHYRVQAAQRLLVQTNMAVEEVAERCGFQSVSSFYREFRKRVKETPVSYKKRCLGLTGDGPQS